MNRSRARLAAWHYASGLLFQTVTMAIGLIATPLLKNWLGNARFGATRAITDLNGYLGLLEMGLGAALGPLLARSLGQGDERALQQTVSAGVRAYLRISLAILVIGVCLTPVVPRLIHVGPGLAGELRWAWAIGLIAWMAMAAIPFRSISEASQQGYRVNLVLVAQSLVTTAATLALAGAGWGLPGQSLALTAGTILASLAIASIALRRRPGLAGAVLAIRPDPETRHALRNLSVPTLVFTMSSRVGLLTDYLIISFLLGADMATPLYLTQRLAVLAQGQIQAVGNASWAALAELHARGEHATFNRRMIELTRVVMLLGIATLGPIAAYNWHFISLWVGTESNAGDGVIAVAAINALMLGLFSLWTYAFGGTGRVGRVAPAAAVAAGINLIVSVALTKQYGLIGPLLGTTIAFLSVNAWFLPLLLHRDFGISPRDLMVKAVGGPLVLGIPFIGILWTVAHVQRPLGWVGLGAQMGVAAVLFLVLGGRLLLTPNQREAWKSRLRSAFRLRRAEKGAQAVPPPPSTPTDEGGDLDPATPPTGEYAVVRADAPISKSTGLGRP